MAVSMDRKKLIGKKVEHVTWGTGTIITIEDNYAEIAFEDGELKKYQFPAAFMRYMKASEPEIQKEIVEELQVVGRKEKSTVPERPTPREISIPSAFLKHRAVMDATAKLPKSPDVKKNDTGVSNKSPITAESSAQNEGSPAWFRELAAYAERQYHFKTSEKIRENFVNKYSPEKLAQMSGEELLQKIFGSNDSMLYELTSSKASCNIFGAAAHYKYLWIVYSTKKDQWNYYRGGRSRTITEQEAMQRAVEIRDLLVRGASIIKKHRSPNNLADYRFLEQELSSIFLYCYTWVLKYFQMLYPEWFPCMYGDHTLVRALGIIGLPEHGDRYLNLGEIALFTKKCRIPNILLSDIYGTRWGWTETLKPCENAVSNYADSHLSVSDYNQRNV